MQTFAVSDVRPSEQPLEAITLDDALAQRLAKTDRYGGLLAARSAAHTRDTAIEASGVNQERLVRAPGFGGTTHPLIEAVHTAFAEHYPLVLSPDDVWLCLAQGFAMHV